MTCTASCRADLRVAGAIRILAGLILLAGHAWAFESPEQIGGEMSGVIGPGTFLVGETITIRSGEELSCAPGTILYFSNFTGIICHGSLTCKGTRENPIVFTSFNAQPEGTPPQPFDWNGVKTSPQADRLILENVKIAYSTFGLSVESEFTPALLRYVSFESNGYANLSRNGKMIAAEGGAVSYVWPEPSFFPEMNESASGKKTDSSRKPDREWRLRLPLQIAGGSVAVIGGIMAIVGKNQADMHQKSYQEAEDPQLVEVYKELRDENRALRNTGLVLLGIGSVGFGLTFVF